MSSSPIGQPITRIDGRRKVTGRAPYAVEHDIPNMAYGSAVASTIGSGRIVSLDTAEAEKMPGVLTILHHGNIGKLYRPAGSLEEMSRPGESRPPFEDENIYYYGQYVALVIADTFEQAQDAAARVRVKYETKRPVVRLQDAPAQQETSAAHAPGQAEPDSSQTRYKRGDLDAGLQQGEIKLEATYLTPIETHNPMEMHGTIAVWEGDDLTLYESSQGVVNHHNVAAQVLAMPLESIRIVSPFIGSGFGCKLFPWPHSWMTAVAARKVKRPVKFYVPRALMFTTVGHRPVCEQHVRAAATRDGKLTALANEIRQTTSMIEPYLEDCVEPTGMLYSCANVAAQQHEVKLNTGTPTPMRGPGRTPALWALECAMDELAGKCNLDPLEFRLRNYAEQDEHENKPWSSKHLREAYQQGADKFGWNRRTPQVGSMRNGHEIIGMGMATCTWPAHQRSAEVRVRLQADGTVRAYCATQDIGTGTYTLFAEVISDKTGIPLNKIDVLLGDSSLPPGPTSGGSSASATVIPAIIKACETVTQSVVKAAIAVPNSPFAKADPKSLKFTAGRVHRADEPAGGGMPFQEVIAQAKLAALDGRAKGEQSPEQKKYSSHSFGAHFCEIAYDPELYKVRVTRWLTVIDGGRMINLKTARNQIQGSVTMGIGMGLLEETIYDERTAHPINNNFADYMVCTNADVPDIDVLFLDYPDTIINEYGARGIGEIGLTGCASAIASAVHHATGIRVRDLPITVEKLMKKA